MIITGIIWTVGIYLLGYMIGYKQDRVYRKMPYDIEKHIK